MSIFKKQDLVNPIDGNYEGAPEGATKWDEPWNDHSGMEVETFITEELKEAHDKQITGMEYVGSTLRLFRKDGTTIEGEVTPMEPIFIYGIKWAGLKIVDGNSTTIIRPSGGTRTFQYKKNKTVYAGLIIYAIQQTSVTQNKLGQVDVRFQYGSTTNNTTVKVTPIDYNKIRFEGGIGGSILGLQQEDGTPITNQDEIDALVTWVPITNLFTKSISAEITATVTSANEIIRDTFETIVTQKIELQYKNNYIINSNSCSFTLEDLVASDYHLEGFVINSERTTESQQSYIGANGSMTFSDLVPGLNQLVFKAVNNKTELNMASDYISVNIINTLGMDENTTAIAINNVKDTIPNNGVATLYDLTVYSPKSQDIKIQTYLETTPPVGELTQLVKEEIIGGSNYDRDTNIYNTSYKKYIEMESNGVQNYLVIKINDEFYKFYDGFTDPRSGNIFLDEQDYKTMTIEPLDSSLIYTSPQSPFTYNFDQFTGYSNNLFVTKAYATAGRAQTIIDDIETSDGWQETNGQLAFKISAQEKPIFIGDGINLQLGSNFSLEYKFRTYNISDETLPIFTLGKLQMRSNQICWNVETSEDMTQKELDDQRLKFLARNAQFEDNVDIHAVITVQTGYTIKEGDTYYPTYLEDAHLAKFTSAMLKAENAMNLVKVYLNGTIAREFLLDTAELRELINSKLQFNPKGADVDIMLFRVYNQEALNDGQIVQNYIASLPTKEDKLRVLDINNILASGKLTDNKEITFNKCYGKFNTIVYVLPKGCRVPTRDWGGQDDKTTDKKAMKKFPVTVFVNYVDDAAKSHYDVEDLKHYSGKLINMYMTSQGSSAMRYLIWNIQTATNKFETRPSKFISVEDANMDETGLNFSDTASTTFDGFYQMPRYQGQKYTNTPKIAKLVGKVNFASSMQSHKLGAVKSFNDLYAVCKNDALPAGMKACTEEPFLYFFWESDKTFASEGDDWREYDDTDIAKTQLSELLDESNSDKIKFFGFQTWGSAKADKETYGMLKTTPEYLLLEGGENSDTAVNFRCPWHALQRATGSGSTKTFVKTQVEGTTNPLTKSFPTISKADSIARPWDNLLIESESIVYNDRGAWDIDAGVDELEDKNAAPVNGKYPTYFEFKSKVHDSLKHFRAFFDFVYKYDYTYRVINNPANQIITPNADWSNYVQFKVCMSNPGTFNDGHGNSWPVVKGDLLRYEEYSERWVPAGVYYDLPNNRWESLNVFTDILNDSSYTRYDLNTIVRQAIKDIFSGQQNEDGSWKEEGITQYVNHNDIAFHQAFIKFLSGTDNRAKNTYFQIIGPVYTEKRYTEEEAAAKNEGKPEEEQVKAGDKYYVKPADTNRAYDIRLTGDDLDTILLTDNAGLQSKKYNLLEASYKESDREYWGDANNVFFYMYDQCFEPIIKSKLQLIINNAFTNSDMYNKENYFNKVFFDVQETYPAIAYNHTSKIYYENGWFAKKADILGSDWYTNNGIDPIEQAHGSSLSEERWFMKKRLHFLATYAQATAGLGQQLDISSPSAGGTAFKMKAKLAAHQDFYPTLMWNGTTLEYLTSPNDATKRQDLFKLSGSVFDCTSYVASTEVPSIDIKCAKDVGAINALIESIDSYKSLEIEGLNRPNLTGNFAHLTDLVIKNDFSDTQLFGSNYPPLSITNFGITAPVLKNLTLNNMNLPASMDLSAMNKLEVLDLTNTLLNQEVVLPETGHLKKVILPKSTKILRIYNNPNLSEVDFQGDQSSLTTVYINCAAVGFDVNAFIETLTDCPNLTSVTLKNAYKGTTDNSLYITEQAMMMLARLANCDIQGQITVVSTAGTKIPSKNVSLADKQILLQKFKDFTKADNYTRIIFDDIEILGVSITEQVTTYSSEYPISKGNIFNLQVDSGNDVAIISPEGTPVLNIEYSINCPANVATIDKYSGELTLVGPSATSYTVTVKITRINGVTITRTSTIKFQWEAPKIGDFAYADGSFSTGYNSRSTIVGLVYDVVYQDVNGEIVADKNSTAITQGTAYIIGTNYATSEGLRGGYVGDADDVNNNEIKDLYNIKKTILPGLSVSDQYYNVTRSAVPSDVTNNIIGSSLSSVTFEPLTQYKGKEDTKNFVDHVNNFLGQLRKNSKTPQSIKNLITIKDEVAYIASMDNLISLCDKLRELPGAFGVTLNTSDKLTSVITTLLYPYFYAMNLYEPTVNEGENLNTAYAKGNWYAPSYYELARVIYQRGYSVNGSAFNSAADVQGTINTSASIQGAANGSEAIFYNGIKNSKGSLSGQAWANITSSANICTTGTGNTNLSYQRIDNGNNQINYQWTSVDTSAVSNNYWYGTSLAPWRPNVRQGIPFTQFNFKKA